MITHRAYISLAIPLIISTVTTPLLGAVDTAAVGQLPDPSYIGGVAVGSVIFNTLYWLFGFLRVSTSGFAAQAHGANDQKEGALSFFRPLYMAICIGAIMVIGQQWIGQSALELMNPERTVFQHAHDYFKIRIWGAPFALMNYVLLGWLMGMSKIKASLALQLYMNITNIVLDLLFVSGFGWGVKGVAAATLIAEVSTFFIGLPLVIRYLKPSDKYGGLLAAFNMSALARIMKVNGDLFIRTICLLAVFNNFTAKGASFGTEVLAANAILIQIYYIMAYFFDGLANAGSILMGRAIGARNHVLYNRTLSLSYQWSLITVFIMTVTYYITKDHVIQLFTSSQEVQSVTLKYSPWLLLFPIAACFGLVLYGIFTGAAETKAIRNSMLLSLTVYCLIIYAVPQPLNNHRLWLAFLCFSAGRSLFLFLYLPSLKEKDELCSARDGS